MEASVITDLPGGSSTRTALPPSQAAGDLGEAETS
jgi:hypothetical protein